MASAPHIVLPTGQRMWPPEMKYAVARDGKSIGLRRQDVKVPFDTPEIAQQWLNERVAPAFQHEHTVIEALPEFIEPIEWVRLRETIKPGMIVENCSCQAVKVISVDYDNGDMVCVSVHNGENSNCDLYHCGIVALDPAEIERKKQIYDAAGGRDEGRKALGEDWRRRRELEDQA